MTIAQELARRIVAFRYGNLPAESDEQFAAEVIVATRDGRKLARRVPHALCRGPANPMSGEELWRKFEDCAALALPEPRIGPLFEALERLETLALLGDLTRLIELRPGDRAATGRAAE